MRAHGIEFNVAADLQQIHVAVHQHRLEAPLEQVPDFVVTAIEGLRESTIHVPHQPRAIALTRVEDQVVLDAHQTVGQYLRIKAVHCLFHHGEQCMAIDVVRKDGLAAVATGGDVIVGAGDSVRKGRDLGW